MRLIELNEKEYNCIGTNISDTLIDKKIADLVEEVVKRSPEFAEVYARHFNSNINELSTFMDTVSRVYTRIVATLEVSSEVEVNYDLRGKLSDEEASEYIRENFSIADVVSDNDTDFSIRDMWVDSYRSMIRFDQYATLIARAA